MDQTSDLIGSSPRRVKDRRLLLSGGRYLLMAKRASVRRPSAMRLQAITTADVRPPARPRET